MFDPSHNRTARFADSTDTDPLASRSAGAAAVLVLLMFCIYAATGIGQDPLQYVHGSAEYTAILLRNPPVLRASIGLDNLFIVCYLTMFLALAAQLWQHSQRRALLAVATALLFGTAFLDLFENMHFLSMIAVATQGIAIDLNEIQIQVWESLVKFHISYIGLFLLSFTLPRATRVERALVVLLRWIQLPVGLLIYLTPAAVAIPLVMVRFAFFLAATLMVAYAFHPRRFGSGEPA